MQPTLGATERATSTGDLQQALRVPLLSERLDALSPERREFWLDLGRIQPALVERLAVGPNYLVVGDHQGPNPDRGLPAPLPRPSRRFDVILAWDWINYLDPHALKSFGRDIAGSARSGTQLHALIHYRAVEMPKNPQDFRLSVDGRLGHVTAVGEQCPAPRYSPKALEKAMPEWRVERTLLLNNGMQEFVLERTSV
jgi:hypothetical protein